MGLKAFTANSKTILSVDFSRSNTCSQICDYCYVENMEKIYPAYSNKTTRNYEWSLSDADGFANQLNTEYRKQRNSKAKTWKQLDKLPVRIYGSGDYIPAHYNFLSKLKFKFFIISKTLTLSTMQPHIKLLLDLPNLTSLVFSIDNKNCNNYNNIMAYYKQDRCKIAFTGMPEDFQVRKNAGENYDIFFNIGTKKADLLKSRNYSEQCPCDSKVLAHEKSCSVCNKCWRSSVTRTEEWNKL